MKHSYALCLVLSVFLCLTSAPAPARQATLPFADVPLTDQDFNDFQSLQAVGELLYYYPYGNYSGRRPMTRYEFAIGLAHLWTSLNPQTHSASADVAASRHDQDVRLQSHPLALAALKRLVNDFQPELTQLGQDVPALQAYLVALRPGLSSLPVSPPFPDVPRSHWAYQSVETLRKAGIVTGDHGRYQGDVNL